MDHEKALRRIKKQPRPYLSYVPFSRSGTNGTVGTASTWTKEDWQAHYDERIGIAVCDGKQPEARAQELAWEACVSEWLSQHPKNTPPHSCAHCGQKGHAGADIIPFGIADCHTWLHSGCWQDWYNQRRRQAEEALRLIGLG
jgi:hypothetical protein